VIAAHLSHFEPSIMLAPTGARQRSLACDRYLSSRSTGPLPNGPNIAEFRLNESSRPLP
jgi:hypothetical protein